MGRTDWLRLRVQPAWKRWLDLYAAQKGVTVTDLVTEAVERQAKRDRFESPPVPGEADDADPGERGGGGGPA